MNNYTLKNILLSFADEKGNRRTLFNLAPLGGISSNLVKIFLFSLPFIIYASIFNSYVFNTLGIATAILAFIILLTNVMLIVFFIHIVIKKKVIKKIQPVWNSYFPNQDLTLVLSSGVTPYSEFFKRYSEILKQNMTEEEMYKSLINAFEEMERDNQELLNAIKRNK
jgi:type III secretory pathway component EscR